jgi:hypothetical protein
VFLLKVLFCVGVLLPAGGMAIEGVAAKLRGRYFGAKDTLLSLIALGLSWSTFGIGIYSVFVDWSFARYALISYFLQFALQIIVAVFETKEPIIDREAFRTAMRMAAQSLGIKEFLDDLKASLRPGNVELKAAPDSEATAEWKKFRPIPNEGPGQTIMLLGCLAVGWTLYCGGLFTLIAYTGWLQLEVHDLNIPGAGISCLAIILGSYLRKLGPANYRIHGALAHRQRLYPTGLLLLLLGVAITYVTMQRLIIPLPMEFWNDTTYYVLITINCVLISWGIAFIRPHAMIGAQRSVLADQRRPVLYLRSFARETRPAARKVFWLRHVQKLRSMKDLVASVLQERSHPGEMEQTMKQVLEGRGIFGPLTLSNLVDSFASGRGRNYDEQFVIANLMKRVGPYIAVARPSETADWGDVGAVKLYVPDSEWQTAVGKLIEQSVAIVVEAGHSDGLLWEIQEIVRRAEPTKVLVLLPMTDGQYDDFSAWAGRAFPVVLPTQRPPSRFMSFRYNWEPWVLGQGIADIDEAYMQRSCDTILRPFFEQNGLRPA